MKSVWGAQVRTLEEDELSEECVCKPPRVCLCCHRPPEAGERDLLYAYQGLKDTTKDAERVEDHLPASIHQGASNLHSDKDMKDAIRLAFPLWVTPHGIGPKTGPSPSVDPRGAEVLLFWPGARATQTAIGREPTEF